MATPRDGETELEMLERQAAYLTGLTGHPHLVVEGRWVVPLAVLEALDPADRPAVTWSPEGLPEPPLLRSSCGILARTDPSDSV